MVLLYMVLGRDEWLSALSTLFFENILVHTNIFYVAVLYVLHLCPSYLFKLTLDSFVCSNVTLVGKIML